MDSIAWWRERLYEGLVRLVVAWISEIAHFTGMMIILSIEWRELQKDIARGRVEKVSERETRGKREKEARGNLTPEASWAWRHPEGAGYAAWIGRQEVGRRRWRRWRWCSQPVGVGLYSRPPCKASFLRIPLLSLSPSPLCLSAQAFLSSLLPSHVSRLIFFFSLVIRTRWFLGLFSTPLPSPNIMFHVSRNVYFD